MKRISGNCNDVHNNDNDNDNGDNDAIGMDLDLVDNQQPHQHQQLQQQKQNHDSAINEDEHYLSSKNLKGGTYDNLQPTMMDVDSHDHARSNDGDASKLPQQANNPNSDVVGRTVNNMYAQNVVAENEMQEMTNDQVEKVAKAVDDSMPRVVGGVYDISARSLLGRGAFSVVYEGFHTNTKDKVAVKAITVLPDQTAAGFMTELKANRMVDGHVNVVRLLDHEVPKDNLGYMMFEVCSRGEVFEQIKPGVGLIPRECIGSYYAQLVEAVVYIHSMGVCHLDIKPENLFVTDAGVVKLGDFGLCSFLEDGPVQGCHGSMCYAAPENIKSGLRKGHDAFGCPPIAHGYDGKKADIWSVGVVLFVLMYGMAPWDVARESSYEYRMYKLSAGYPNINPWMRIPTVIRTILHHTVWPRPNRRWAAEALRTFLQRDLGWNPSPPRMFKSLDAVKAKAARAAQAQACGGGSVVGSTKCSSGSNVKGSLSSPTNAACGGGATRQRQQHRQQQKPTPPTIQQQQKQQPSNANSEQSPTPNIR